MRRFGLRARAWPGIAAFAILTMVTATFGRAESRGGALASVLRLIPPDAHAAIVIPNIKHASDTLTRLLEGMDRANILLGSRPIDQFKSATGYTSGVDDVGAAAMILLDAGVQPPRTLWLIPVTDAKVFLEGNFTGRDGAAYTREDGARQFIKEVGAHVAISNDEATLHACNPGDGEGWTPMFNAAITDADNSAIDACHIVVLARQPLFKILKQRALGAAAQRGTALPAVALLAKEFADDADTAIVGVEFDPLALVMHGIVTFNDQADFGTAVPAEHPNDAGLARLPAKPLALAVSANIAAMGGETMLNGVARTVGEPDGAMPLWLQKTAALQFAFAPSAAGAAGGLLNEAMLVLATPQAEEVRQAIKSEITHAADVTFVKRQSAYRENIGLPGGATADTWEIKTLDVPPELMQLQALETLLFGSAGMHGYVRALPNAVLMTFSQRPGVLQTLSETVEKAAIAEDAATVGFQSQSMIRTMRRWMPAERDIEWYANLGLLREMLEPALRGVALPEHLLPAFDANLPPVGGAVDVRRRRAVGAVVVPAGVLTPIFDLAAESLRMRPAPADDPANQ